jgi:hypothetical protein
MLIEIRGKGTGVCVHTMEMEMMSYIGGLFLFLFLFLFLAPDAVIVYCALQRAHQFIERWRSISQRLLPTKIDYDDRTAPATNVFKVFLNLDGKDTLGGLLPETKPERVLTDRGGAVLQVAKCQSALNRDPDENLKYRADFAQKSGPLWGPSRCRPGPHPERINALWCFGAGSGMGADSQQ